MVQNIGILTETDTFKKFVRTQRVFLKIFLKKVVFWNYHANIEVCNNENIIIP